MTGCPPVEDLLEFAAGKLSDDARQGIETHIDDCVACRASLSSLAKGDVPSTSFGRYRLETVLGSGGMGIVYRAWDPQLARPVAIKVVRQTGGDAQLRTRLVREAQSLARLSHPNVCHCYDVGTDGEEVWVAMELIDGTTLRAWSAGKSHDELLDVLLGAAEGIAAAHASGLIHRDIKPENVLVTHSGRPVVTDFGLARVDLPVDPSASTVTGDPLLTATGAIVGTPAYLAPEQLTGDPLDARVDQFAWATMAWELLTGTKPFPTIAAIRLDAIRAGVTAPASLPKPIAAALMRGMALSAKDRFPSMRELIDALKSKPERSSRAPLVIGGAAALAVAATVIAWQTFKPETPRPVAASTPVAPAPITMPAPTPDASSTTMLSSRAPADAAEVAPPDAKVVTIAKTVLPPKPAAATLPKKQADPPGPGSGSQMATAAVVQPTTTAQPPLRPLANSKYSVVRAYASMMAWCKVPVDFKHPDPALGRDGVVDWGTVVRREMVIATLVDRESYQLLYEVKGQRGKYAFNGASFGALGILDVPIGTQVALCIDPGRSEKFDAYQLPANWQGGLDIVMSVVPISGPPAVDGFKSLAPIHIEDGKLQISGDKGKLQMKPAGHYLVRTKAVAADGKRWDMKNWWLEVGKVKGAELVAPGKSLWFVIETPTFEPGAEGEKPRMVAKAAMVLDEIIPH